MDLIKAKYFQEELNLIPAFQSALILYEKNKSWTNSYGLEVDDAYKALLDKRINKYFKDIANKRIIYKLNKGKVAVIIPALKNIRDTTLENNYKKLEQTYLAADKSFFAKHDPLTGLLNRNGAKNEYEQYLNIQYAEMDNSDSDTEVTEAVAKTVGLIVFDLDHFKQINDSYSHNHGDVVLAVFAVRLFNLLDAIENKYQCKAILSRPGGEEFELLILGELDKLTINNISLFIKNALNSPSLPSKKEFEDVADRLNLKKLEELNTTVTASIGTTYIKFISKTSFHDDYAKLKQQADAALYRAKNDGRDCIRHYEDISKKHGRIFEHHTNSELVVIDIGKNVGVNFGSKYKVYFPPFDGGKAIKKNDGRSEKKLGEYPKIEAGELLVTQVQDNVSICEIVTRVTNEQFPVSSSLEYVPLGSSSRYFKSVRASQHWATCGNGDELTECLDRMIASDSFGGLLILNVYKNLDIREHTSKTLAIISYALPPGSRLFIAHPDLIHAVIPKIKDFNKEINSSLIAMNDLIEVTGGVVDFKKLPADCIKTSTAITFFTDLALSYARSKKLQISFFSVSNASMVIREWLASESVDDAILDYSKLASFGVKHQSIDNQLGLVLIGVNQQGYSDLAEKCFMRATMISPDNKFFGLNLALAMTINGKYKEAYEKLNSLNADKDSAISVSYPLAFAISAKCTYINDKSIHLSKVKSIINRALERSTKKLSHRNYQWKLELEKFIMQKSK